MTKTQTDDDIIAEGKARFTRCQDWESVARDRGLLDARFANGDSYNLFQWPVEARTDRAAHVCLTNNKVRQHNLHVVNDARQHKAAIKVTPTGQGATFEAAEIYSAIIRRIEYQSKAMDAYSTAIYHQVESGIGYCRVVTEYESAGSFDQEIYIRRIKDPRTVFLDPDAHEYDKADMRFAFVFVDTPRKEFEAKYPDVADAGATLDYSDAWDSAEHVREAEYWRRSDKPDKLHRLADGSTIKESELPAGAKAVLDIRQSRDITTDTVEWFQLAGGKIVDRKTWPGRYIPIVPFIGEETVIDGVMDRKGHTRALLDAQRMYNYWSSAATEQVALQGKTPYIAPLRSIEGLETFWDTANTVNHAYLPYNDRDLDTGQQVERPERAQPPVMAQAYMQGMETARQDMMMVSGQYQAEMGAPGNERSGVAIQQRQREGDTATYHYIDNQAKGIRQIGRICLDLIPHIYDVARVIKIMAADGTQSDVHLDPDAMAAHQHVMPPANGQPAQPVTPDQAKAAQSDPDSPDPKVIFNPTIGRYDIEADVGPSFGTQREQAFDAFQQIIQGSPDLVHVAGDLLFKSADFPLADELAERLKRGVPAQYLGGPAPAVLQIQQQMQHMQQAAQQTLQQADAEIAQLKAQLADKAQTYQLDDYRAETDRMKAVGSIDPEALRPVVRELVSQALGTPIVPIMQAHALAMGQGQQGAPGPEAQPGQQPQGGPVQQPLTPGDPS